MLFTVQFPIYCILINFHSYIGHKCYDCGLRAPYDLNSHGARTVAVESHGRREIFRTFFTHRTMNRSF